MGYFSHRKALLLDGQVVEVEGRIGFFGGNEFSLIIDQARADKQKGSLYGFATLYGVLDNGRRVVVTTRPNRLAGGLSGSVLQGMEYELAIDDEVFRFGEHDSPPVYSAGKGARRSGGSPRQDGVRTALRELELLRADGTVTEDEFANKRAEILGRL